MCVWPANARPGIGTLRGGSNRGGKQIMDRFVGICVTVAKRLHDNEVIVKKFGRSVPIIVHELEYYNTIVEATRQANSQGFPVPTILVCSIFNVTVRQKFQRLMRRLSPGETTPADAQGCCRHG